MKSFRSVDENGIVRYTNEKGQLHREDGPAFITNKGHVLWFLNGELHSKYVWKREVLKIKLNRFKEL